MTTQSEETPEVQGLDLLALKLDEGNTLVAFCAKCGHYRYFVESRIFRASQWWDDDTEHVACPDCGPDFCEGWLAGAITDEDLFVWGLPGVLSVVLGNLGSFDECGCLIHDLCPCGEPNPEECVPGNLNDARPWTR